MSGLAHTPGLSEVQTDILAAVRRFVDTEIIPNARELEHADAYPQAIVDGMREMIAALEARAPLGYDDCAILVARPLGPDFEA